MKNIFTFIAIIVLSMAKVESAEKENTTAGSDLPYAEIPAHPEKYTPENVAARMIDGLGFRYYWATDGLRPQDLKFKPSEDGRTTDETLDHIYELSAVIANVAKKIPTVKNIEMPEMTYEAKRKATLENLKTASDILKESGKEGLETFNVLFEKDGEVSEHPFWNLINGPISDAMWHTGQVVSFRRSSGNPIRKGVNYFSGTVSK